MRSWLLKQGEVGEGEWVVILRGKGRGDLQIRLCKCHKATASFLTEMGAINS
jgi:hypothetical protein